MIMVKLGLEKAQDQMNSELIERRALRGCKHATYIDQANHDLCWFDSWYLIWNGHVANKLLPSRGVRQGESLSS